MTHMLPCLKDDPNCPPEIEHMKIPLTPVMMCCLIMRAISPSMENEYNCMTDLLPTDPKRVVEQHTKIETKLKGVTSKMNSEDHQNQHGKGHPDTSKDSQSHKKRLLEKAKFDIVEEVVAHIP